MNKYQKQFDKCCGPRWVEPSKPLTGIEKESQERAETEKMWQELEASRG